MKTKTINTVFVLLLVLISNATFGQRNLLPYADKQYDLKRFEHAGSQYVAAFNENKSYYAAKRAAQSFSSIKSYQKAFDWWLNTITFEESDRSDSLNYARSAVQIGKSLEELNILLTNEEQSLVFGLQKVPINLRIEFRPVDKYNGIGTDYGIRSDLEGRKYFVSDRNVSVQSKKKLIRFDFLQYFERRDRYRFNDRGFHQIFLEKEDGPNKIEVELTGIYHLSTPTFYWSGSKQQVIFTAVVSVEKWKKFRSNEIYPGLYQADVQADGSFGSVRALPFNQSDSFSVMHSFVYGDRLYFSSDMPGGFGGFDLYYAELDGESFGPPINLGEQVNGSEDEVFPYLHEGQIYFSSNRKDGLGGLDIYQIDEQMKGKPSNMGRPYNTAKDDFSFFVDEKGLQYISSDRGMSESRDDIYKITFLQDPYKLRVFAENGERLDELEDLYLEVIGPDGLAVPLENKEGRVGFLNEGDYQVQISKKGYFPASLPLAALVPDGKEKLIDYTLVPIPYGKLLTFDSTSYDFDKQTILSNLEAEEMIKQKEVPLIVLAEDIIFFDLDKHNIRSDAAKVLKKAEALLKKYPFLKLEISSHTDSRYTMLYNDRLSKNRSMSTFFHLKNKGISADRMEIKWFGKTNLDQNCPEGVICDDNMHQLNRRSILKILVPEDQVNTLPSGLKPGKKRFESIQ